MTTKSSGYDTPLYNRRSYEEWQTQMTGFVREFWRENSRAPSVRELQRGLEIRSISVVISWVHRLIEDGYLKGEERTARTLRVPSMRIIFNDEEVPYDDRPQRIPEPAGERTPEF